MSEPVRPDAPSPRLFRFIMIAGLVVFVALSALAAEWGARYYERHRTTPPDYFPQIYYPHRRLGYGLVPNFDYYGWFRINSLGFRGREMSAAKNPGVLRIVCLGGSTTFDIGSIGAAQPWPEVLEMELQKRLRTKALEVMNLGIPGSASFNSLVDLQIRVLDLKPDLLIVYQGLNDFVYSIPPAQAVESPFFPLESPPRSSFARWLRIHSVLFAKTEGRASELLGRLWRKVVGDRKGIIQTRDFALEQGFAAYRSNLISIAAIAQANHIPLVLPQVVLPFSQSASRNCGVCAGLSPLFGGMEPGAIKAMFGRYDAVLSQLAAAGQGVYYIPTGGFVPAEDRYYHDSVHFGPEGSRLMGVKLSEALVPLLKSREGVSDSGNRESKLP